MLQTHFEEIKQDKTVLASYYFRLGSVLCSYGKLSEGRGYFIRSVKAYPLAAKAIGAFPLSLLGKSIYNIVAEGYQKMCQDKL